VGCSVRKVFVSKVPRAEVVSSLIIRLNDRE